MPRPEKHVFVCTQSRPPGHPRGSCSEKGAPDIMGVFSEQFEQKGLWGRFLLTSTGCIGACDAGPSVLVYPEGILYGKVTKEDVAAIIDEHLLGDKPVERLKHQPKSGSHQPISRHHRQTGARRTGGDGINDFI